MEYSLPMGNSTDGDRGLLVISNTAKTKARQRKGAITNWKVNSHILFAIQLLKQQTLGIIYLL